MIKVLNKVALVTAASRGIGRAVAERLARDGFAVVVNYASNKTKAEEVIAAIEAQGRPAVAVQGSVADKADVARMYDTAIERFGKVDIVVNVAGASTFKPTTELTDSDFDAMFSVNARGAMYMLAEAARRVSDGGRIVQFSTGGTAMAVPAGGLYAASKAAGEHLAFALAKELGPRGITVNVVSPGVTDTDGLIMPREAVDGLIAQTPLGRLGQPNDIADVVSLLASDDARWMTGQNLRPTGGIL
ncbi:3-ketoacyl-ACP reductase [Polymorphobacter multimanifer]|nr:SDR family oxidoreductase [Polymorphobacter multimanifer]GGI90444.1 3-ketoacyl-ACP reductase [Polymorphobacter multimanifer]